MASVQITKYSGRTETYDESKLRQSLKNAGASKPLINDTITALNGLLYDGISTQKIYKKLKSLG